MLATNVASYCKEVVRDYPMTNNLKSGILSIRYLFSGLKEKNLFKG